MHPIISDLDLSVRAFERELEHKAVQRDSIARESARIAGRLTLRERIASSVRQFLDPRGFALSQARNVESANSNRRPSGASASSATLTGLPAAADAETSWREAA